jgi:hypothetical protein
MGAWAVGNLENDDALDWLSELYQSRDAATIHAALSRVMEPLKGCAQDRAEFTALAAAEVVACWLGHPPPQPRRAGLVDWSRRHLAITPDFVLLARQALMTIKTRWSSNDCWMKEDGDAQTRWLACIADLEGRLA